MKSKHCLVFYHRGSKCTMVKNLLIILGYEKEFFNQTGSFLENFFGYSKNEEKTCPRKKS